MRQFNFVIIFIFCLVVALFTVENSQPATIQITPGLQVQAAIAIELLVASGFGAFILGLFSVWTHSNQIRQKNKQIQELERKIKESQTEIQSLKLALLPAAGSLTQEAQIAQ